MIRTKEGLILEKLLHDLKHRYLFCWNGETGSAADAYDCACCMIWDTPEDGFCGCVCHERIEKMATQSGVRLWLLASEAMGALPRFFTSYEDKLQYCKEVSRIHKQEQANGSSYELLGLCEFCEFVRQHEVREAKQAVEAEKLAKDGLDIGPAAPCADCEEPDCAGCDFKRGHRYSTETKGD